MRALIGLILLAGLAGCQTKYEEPVGRDTAKLTIVNQASSAAHASTYKEGYDCRDRLVLPPIPAKESIEVRVQPDTEVTLTVRTVAAGLVCAVTGSFNPGRGDSYRLMFRMDIQSRVCSLLFADGAGYPYPMTHKRTFATAMTEAGPWCGPR